MLQATKVEKTPLTKQLDALTNQILVIAGIALVVSTALGLYRNVQISLHRLEQQYAERGTALDPDLGDQLHDLVRDYVCERWPAWVAGKQCDFVARMTTEAGRRRAQVRVERLGSVLAVMRAEVEVFDVACVTGYLAPVIYFMQHRRNPSLSADLAVLETRWPQDSAPAAARFVELVRRESAGAI